MMGDMWTGLASVPGVLPCLLGAGDESEDFFSDRVGEHVTGGGCTSSRQRGASVN